MKKQGRITLIILAGMLVAYIIAITTGMVKTAVIRASSNEPNMYPGTRIGFIDKKKWIGTVISIL